MERVCFEWSRKRFPEVGQNIVSDSMAMIEGTRVSATASATRTPSPTTTPIVFRKTTEVKASERNEMITVAPLVAMLSPAHVIDLMIASLGARPLTRSSLYREMMKTL